MKQISTEKFIEKLGIEVYPITIIKFLLNRRRILSYFKRAENKNFEIRGTRYLLDNSNCEACKSKKDDGIICRQHTSINRVVNGENVGFDTDTGSYFYKNEIFKMVGNKLVIIYCPHPKLIKTIGEEITDFNVRKVNPITIEDSNFKMKNYQKVISFSSDELLKNNMKCWFNDLFSIVTLIEDKDFSNWCLIPNSKNHNT